MVNRFFAILSFYPWQHLFFCLAPLGSALIYLVATIGTGDALITHFAGLRQQYPQFTNFLRLFSGNANLVLYAVYGALLWNGLRTQNTERLRQIFYFAIVQICISALLVQGLKILVGSPRPLHSLVESDNMPFSLKNKYHSFPSGHTTEIVNASLTLVVWFRYRLFSLAMGLLTALVGLSRIYFSQHHISDVVAGIVLGSLASLLIHFLLCRRECHYEQPCKHAPKRSM